MQVSQRIRPLSLFFVYLKSFKTTLFSLFVLFFYSVCQEVPEEPVVSPVSNHVFERRLIVKHLQVTETDPINNEPLTEDQLIDIKGISGYLSLFFG